MFKCSCGVIIDTAYEFGSTITCECGKLYNPFGQEVTSSLENIDPAYAGEEW